ncbi:hypothetical protein [Sphingobacterium sp. UDSM-2020]|uniref:hypothetical protein n=1 Tax=Sphingobacterium TaxID=28453 RepID=UPI001937AAD7|nr:hypothetical protein [Sphingobacterium sp. UDSM-2020]QQD13976.1 hypothetical protein JAZ75_00060 [Sphingobacterium sp. UDSM-2020]
MKKTFLFALLSSFGLSLTYGQYSTNQYSITDKVPKVIYKDLKDRNFPKVELLGKQYSSESALTLKEDSIKTVEISKEKQAIIIGLTADYKPEFITLSDLRKNFTNVQSDRVIFQIEDKIIQDDPNTVFVDIINIMTITVSPIKFVGNLDDLYMVSLKVRNEKNIKDMDTIRIR